MTSYFPCVLDRHSDSVQRLVKTAIVAGFESSASLFGGRDLDVGILKLGVAGGNAWG